MKLLHLPMCVTAVFAASTALASSHAQEAPAEGPAPAPAAATDIVQAQAATLETPPAADGPTVVKAAVDTSCELHIWPAERFQAQTTGWLSGFGILGALADSAAHAEGDKSDRTQMASALDPAGQLAALQSLDLANMLGGRPANFVYHPVALDPKTLGKNKTRRSASASPCYSELIVTMVMYEKRAIYGRSLRTGFYYREYGSAKADPLTYAGRGGNGLKLFPAAKGEDVQAANEELVTVFKNNFAEYANNVRKSLATKRGKKKA